jgi:hypothetical protein
MLDIDLRADFRRVTRSLKGLEDEVEKAASRAINDTLKQVRTQARREIKHDLNLRRAKHVMKNVVIDRANKRTLSGRVIGKGKAIPASDIKGARAAKRNGVTFSYWGKTVHIQRGFKYNTTYFKHTGKKRLPIQRIVGPSIPITMIQNSIRKVMTTKAERVFPGRFRYHLKREIDRLRLR